MSRNCFAPQSELSDLWNLSRGVDAVFSVDDELITLALNAREVCPERRAEQVFEYVVLTALQPLN
jgi:hypothetical protein